MKENFVANNYVLPNFLPENFYSSNKALNFLALFWRVAAMSSCHTVYDFTLKIYITFT